MPRLPPPWPSFKKGRYSWLAVPFCRICSDALPCKVQLPAHVLYHDVLMYCLAPWSVFFWAFFFMCQFVIQCVYMYICYIYIHMRIICNMKYAFIYIYIHMCTHNIIFSETQPWGGTQVLLFTCRGGLWHLLVQPAGPSQRRMSLAIFQRAIVPEYNLPE